jgi:predicted RNA binding protein YcfA (HicA-like mRNA interferase family)
MSRDEKIYRKLLETGKLDFSEFQRLLVAFGYRFKRQNGNHMAYRHAKIPDTRIVQPIGKAAKPYQLEQFLDMIEKFRLTMDGEND